METYLLYNKTRGVFVHAYQRWRLGKREFVRQHWRSWPGQLTLGFE